jgi:hypothetical protein
VKVFGTGWQRTGTTSLARALGSLGLATKDYPKELLHDPQHELLTTHDAFTDNPIPLLYPELDRRFPGARFVHTQRDDQAWLASCEWLFTVGRVKFDWASHPIVDEMHLALYGTTEFEPERFLERYRRHNREVQAHFADRPGDLLVLDITRGEGFERLCPFLGLPVPEQDFPHWNRTEGFWKVMARKLARRLRGSR